MREVLPISVGNTGNKIADWFWHYMNLEHKITDKGEKDEGHDDLQDTYHDVYYNDADGTFRPRGVMCDLGVDPIENTFKENSYTKKNQFDWNNIRCGVSGAGNIYANGFLNDRYPNAAGTSMCEDVMDLISAQLDACDNC